MSRTSLQTRFKSLTKKSKRPFGVYAIIVLLILILVTNALDLARVYNGLPSENFPNRDPFVVLSLNIAIGAACLVLALGLWRMQEKAWYAAMIVSGAYLFFTIWRYFDGGAPFMTMALLVFIIFYLNQREIRRAFEKTAKTEPKRD